MNRRRFLSLLALTPISLATSCDNRNRVTIEAAILGTQDQLFQLYNEGVNDTISSFLEQDFSFVDGNIVGNGRLFEQRLSRLNRYHSRQGILPLVVANRTVNVVGDIGWIACEVIATPECDHQGLVDTDFYVAEWALGSRSSSLQH